VSVSSFLSKVLIQSFN